MDVLLHCFQPSWRGKKNQVSLDLHLKMGELVTLLLDPEVKDMLDEIAEIRGISLHKLITHWTRRHYGTLRKPVQ